jgi:hypothetical protein
MRCHAAFPCPFRDPSKLVFNLGRAALHTLTRRYTLSAHRSARQSAFRHTTFRESRRQEWGTLSVAALGTLTGHDKTHYSGISSQSDTLKHAILKNRTHYRQPQRAESTSRHAPLFARANVRNGEHYLGGVGDTQKHEKTHYTPPLPPFKCKMLTAHCSLLTAQ